MKRTRPTPLIGLGVAGIVIGFLWELGTVAAGGAVLVPPLSLPITLIAIAIIVVVFAIPIRRAVQGRSKARIDPFRAARVVVLAKACSLAGALLTGGGLGILSYQLTRSILPSAGSLWLAGAATFGALVLLIAGLIAEHLCALPPSDDEEEKLPSQHAA
ncbi:MAG: DUF3180 domain-containing protein [Microbacteriaceae bacterium]|nr:MAG: DUF3180 domain-containing protein [Microbacteriaceae bacterium]